MYHSPKVHTMGYGERERKTEAMTLKLGLE